MSNHDIVQKIVTQFRQIWLPHYDVFLAHNHIDRRQILMIENALNARGLKTWLDFDQVRPGVWFQDAIQDIIPRVKSAAIFIGQDGLGKWQKVELRIFISECVERDKPVIPVFLPGVKDMPKDLSFLKEFSSVRFGKKIDDPVALAKLEWGIRGNCAWKSILSGDKK
jgi:hypothetical protein